MPEPLAICIEDLDAQSRSSKFLRCVAVAGRQPGLRLDAAGQVLWQSEDQVSCELWVSADEQLILFRPEHALPVTLHRAGRSLQVPTGKPVVVVDQDQVDVGFKHLRIHLHGRAPAVSAPSPLPVKPRQASRIARAAAVVGALSAATSGMLVSCEPADTTPTIDIRDNPPEPMIVEDPTPTPTIEIRADPPEVMPPDPDQSLVDAIMGDWQVKLPIEEEGEQVWVTGTLEIYTVYYRFTPSEAMSGTLAGEGGLGFLVEHPEGVAYVDYWAYDSLENLPAGERVATCDFRVGEVSLTELAINVRDANTLRLEDLSGEAQGWSITRQWR